MRHSLIVSLCLTLCAAPALAQPRGPQGRSAAEPSFRAAQRSLDDANARVLRAGGRCGASLSGPLSSVGQKVRALQGGMPDRRAVEQLQSELSGVAAQASRVGCPYQVQDALQKALGALEDGRVALMNERRRGREDNRPRSAWAELGAVAVQSNVAFEGERAVRLSVPVLRLGNLNGGTFYFAARFRSYEGDWSPWVTTRTWSVTKDWYEWSNPFTHYLRYSTLAEEDFSGGRFVARVAVFDGSGRELASRDVSFKVRLPKLPPAPPPPMQAPPPPVARRDCGTGPDVGCTMTRGGVWPMDAAAWGGFLNALRGNPNEMLRRTMARDMLRGQALTALQLGLLLDLFANEMVRLEVARFAAPVVVNPQHALGYASKWANPQLGSQYTRLMASQPSGGPTPPAPPHPGPRPPHQQYPGAIALPRDCGTGTDDPGCSIILNGRAPMDAVAWSGFLASLRGTPNELVRLDMVRSVMGSNLITARQLSAVMDQFANELVRLDAVRVCASKVVNPQHALGDSVKFRNALNGQEYVRVMSAQRR